MRDVSPFSLVVGVPFREDATGARLSQLDELLKRFAEGVFVHPERRALVIVAEQSNDSQKFNRGQALNCAFAHARERYGASINASTRYVCHDCDMAPSASCADAYFEREGGELETVRVLEARGGRYDATACFGGVTIYDWKAYERTNGYPNGFWGWGGEDNAAFARVRDADVRVERTKDVEFDDMELNDGVDTLESKLSRLDMHNARIAMKEKVELLRMNSKNWREDGLSSLRFAVLSEKIVLDTPTLTCAHIEVEMLSDRPGYVTCFTCEKDLTESEFSAASLAKVKWAREKFRSKKHERSCKSCTASMPTQLFHSRNAELNKTNAERVTCAVCSTRFNSRSALFKHLRSTPCGEE